MGQCASSKSAAVPGKAARVERRSPGSPPMSAHSPLSPTVENNNNNNKVAEEVRATSGIGGKRLGGSYTKGVATSFGFRRRIASDNSSTTTSKLTSPAEDNRRITSPTIEFNTSCDSNGNSDTESHHVSRLGTTRLPAPKKEPAATRGVSRFGFRQARPASVTVKQQPNDNATNATTVKTKNNINNNNNAEKPRAKSAITKTVTISPSVPKHKLGSVDTVNNAATPKSKPGSRPSSALPIPSAPAVVRCTMHSSQLPKPQIVRVRPVDNAKNAKTAANNSRREGARYGYSTEESGISSKEGSVTGDSGVGSQTSSGDADLIHATELLSPEERPPRPRHLGTLVSGRGVYDVRDLVDDEFTEDGVVTDVAVIPLPKLPSVFSSGAVSTGVVRERTEQYQRQLDRQNSSSSRSSSEIRRPARISLTDDSEEEKSYRDLVSTEKGILNANSLASSFRRFELSNKPKVTSLDLATSVSNLESKKEEPRIPPDWSQGGEAMLDSNMYEQLSAVLSTTECDSSISENLTNKTPLKEVRHRSDLVSPSQLQNLNLLVSPTGVTSERHGAISKNQSSGRSVTVTIEDPFAAVAAKSGCFLDDETSPQDSLISSLTEESDNPTKRSHRRNSKSSITGETVNKDLRSPLSPASPGTPTNTSLSLSEGRDFLIDDEIADQPALIFDESITNTSCASATATIEDEHDADETINEVVYRRSRSNSEHVNDVTLVNVTPKKLRRRQLGSSLAASIDTLSPCDSITSDDLMMDFDHSHSSIDDSTDRLNEGSNSALHSLDEVTLRSELERPQNKYIAREWTSLLSHAFSNKDLSASGTRMTTSFLRRPSPSSVPESPRLLNRARITGPSPLSRLHRPSPPPSLSGNGHLGGQPEDPAHELLEIKSLVLKLQSVLQQKETLNSFPNKNGLHGSGVDSDKEDSDREECEEELVRELQRQVEFLQTQLEDRERHVRQLEGQMARFSLNAQLARRSGEQRDVCNAATQTDRVRPLSAGPSLLQALPSDSAGSGLVSVNEQPSRRTSRPHSMVEMNTLTSPVSRGLQPTPMKLWRSPGEPPPPSMFNQPVLNRSITGRTSRIPSATAISS